MALLASLPPLSHVRFSAAIIDVPEALVPSPPPISPPPVPIDHQTAACVNSYSPASRLGATVCPAPVPNVIEPYCNKRHRLFDFHFRTPEEARRAIATMHVTGHGELDNATDLVMMFEAASAELDYQTMIIELRSIGDDGCFEPNTAFENGLDWNPDGMPTLEPLVRWRWVSHIFGAWAGAHEIALNGEPNQALTAMAQYSSDIFAKRAPPVFYNGGMHYGVMSGMTLKAESISETIPTDRLASPASRTQYVVGEVLRQYRAICSDCCDIWVQRGASNELGNFGSGQFQCVHGIGHGLAEIYANRLQNKYNWLPRGPYDPNFQLRYKPTYGLSLTGPQRDELLRQQQEWVQTAAMGFYHFLYDNEADQALYNTEDVGILYQGLFEGFHSAISVQTTEEFISSELNTCARVTLVCIG